MLTFDITWETHPDVLANMVGVYAREFRELFHELMDYWRGELERYAKENHPWKNVTGEAEDKLHAILEEIADGWMISLLHGVSYGVWLELKGYAIINPTMEAHYAAFMHDLRDLVEG